MTSSNIVPLSCQRKRYLSSIHDSLRRSYKSVCNKRDQLTSAAKQFHFKLCAIHHFVGFIIRRMSSLFYLNLTACHFALIYKLRMPVVLVERVRICACRTLNQLHTSRARTKSCS